MSDRRHGHVSGNQCQNGQNSVVFVSSNNITNVSQSEKVRLYLNNHISLDRQSNSTSHQFMPLSNGSADGSSTGRYAVIQLGGDHNIQLGNQSQYITVNQSKSNTANQSKHDTENQASYLIANQSQYQTSNQSQSNSWNLSHGNMVNQSTYNAGKQSQSNTGNQSPYVTGNFFQSNANLNSNIDSANRPAVFTQSNKNLYLDNQTVSNSEQSNVQSTSSRVIHPVNNVRLYQTTVSVNNTNQYTDNQHMSNIVYYVEDQSRNDTKQNTENQSSYPEVDNQPLIQHDKQQYTDHSQQDEQKGEESQSLLCSETFTSPTPPSDDSGWTQPGTSVVWTHSANSSDGRTFISIDKSLSETGVKSYGPFSSEQYNSKIGGATDKGELLKAALLGGDKIHCDTKTDSEFLKKDINSNFQNKCADDSLKLSGNDVDSGWRMSGSNGFDRNRMTGSLTGGNHNNLSRLSDGSSGQGHTQPQVATAEGMLLGRIGGTGGVALHDIGSRSIVAGTAGSTGPQVTLASVFRPPQSVPESGRFTTAFTSASGTTAVSPYSGLYATGSHGAGLAPYSAFYSQYPGYPAGVMQGTLDPQFGSYSAVLQSMGSHAAQSQVPRSPYGASTGTGATGVLGQYPHHLPRTTSPGGKTFISNTNLSAHEREDSKFRREFELDKRRYSTGVLKDDKSHHFSVPSGFSEPARASYSSALRESPSHSHDPQDYYKVPSGREGSLKHRILRPSESSSSGTLGNPQHSAFTNTDEPLAKRTKSESLGVKDFSQHSSLIPGSGLASSDSTSQERSPHLHYPPHFRKGSIIQLGNGELKRVEDLETDDFRHSAHVSSDLKIDSSTVVHIEVNSAQGTAVLGFVVGEHKIQVTVEATVEHPFFVFGQGWSSCEPNWTMKRYGLECHKLSVGDVCISLTHKDVSERAAEISQQQKRENLEGTPVYEKDLKTEPVQQVQRDSPGQVLRNSPGQGHRNSPGQGQRNSPGQGQRNSPGQGHRNRSPANSQSPTIQGQGYRSESGQYNESSTASVKGERLFGSPVSSQIPSSSQTQEQRSLPSTTS